jgi:hypothetical protein
VATIALTVVGYAIGGPVGGLIGGYVGAYIDRRWVFPPDDIVGPKIDDFNFQTASEGALANYCLSANIPCAGEVIWLSDLKETKHEEDSGGKGGGGPSMISYTYSCSVAVAVCINEEAISRIKRIYVGARAIWKDTETETLTSDELEAEKVTTYITFPNGTYVVDKVYLKINAPGSVDLLKFNSGANVLVSGFAESGNNGEFLCTTAETNGDGTKSLWLINENAVDEAAGENVTLQQTMPQFNSDEVESVRIHKGSLSQDRDPIIEAAEGTDKTPAFRGVTYVVFENLQLANFGNQLPQFRFRVEADASNLTIGFAISKLLLRAGLLSSQYDTSQVTETIKGYLIQGPRSTLSCLEEFFVAFNLFAQEVEGKLVVYEKGSEAVLSIPSTEVAAHTSGERMPPELMVSDVSGIDFPQEVNIRHFDTGKGLESGSQRYRRINRVSDHTINLDFNISMSSGDARKIAKRLCWEPWADRFTGEAFITPKHHVVQEGDIVTVTKKGTNEQFRITTDEVTRGNNGVVRVKGIVRNTGVFDFSVDVIDDPDYVDPDPTVAPVVTLLVMNVAPLRAEDVSLTGYYLAVCASDPLADWNGAGVYISSDNVTYALIAAMSFETSIGQALTVLTTQHSRYWDMVSTVDVKLYHGTLSSKTELEVLNGANRMLLGKEIIAFQTATLIDTNTYRLSKLLRGLRNTETTDARSSHQVGELCCLLSSQPIEFVSFSPGLVNAARYFKAVPAGGSLANVLSQNTVLGGTTARPFSPTHVTGTFNASNDLLITWERRTRSPFRLYGPGTAPLIDPEEIYEIDIVDSGGTVVVTYQITGSTKSYTYTAADQILHGFTPGVDDIIINIFMVNDTVGRSLATVAIFSP